MENKDFLTFGEKDVFSQNTEEPPVESEEDGFGRKKVKKSFLDDLLYLPELKKDNISKEEVSRYLSLLDRKKSQVENRMKILADREKKLKSIENEIDKKLEKLDEEMLFFQQTLQKEKKLSEERLNKLVSFYQKVDPKKSAPVFEKLDKDLVVSLFNKLSQKQVTKILSLMNPDKSVELTEYYGRLKSAKEYMLLKEINSELKKEFETCKEES